MAGILVSGGTYSGSGDVTCDWVAIGELASAKVSSAGGTFTAPDGTLTLTSQETNIAFFKWGGTFNHNSGTVLFNGTMRQQVSDYVNGP